jgi:hypothetical protein
MSGKGCAAFGNPFVRGCDSKIVLQRAGEFDLVPVAFDDTRKISGAAKSGIESALRNTLRQCTFFE